MSRIERALEKASRIRQREKATLAPSAASAESAAIPKSVFTVDTPLINPAAVNEHIVCLTAPQSIAAEQYRTLRARIFKSTEKDFLNSLMVTSSVAGEGKTITSINLAITIAQEIDHTVLLIDTDLRKPSIHTYLGIENKMGLSEYLQSKAELADVLIKTGVGKLVLLPAGAPPSNPSELLASEKMMELVREMKYRYRDRYIIFDSSPLLTSADGLYLKEYIDGVIFVVKAASTSEKSVDQALALLKETKVLGTVFNSVPEHLSNRMETYQRQNATENGSLNAAAVMQRAENMWAAVAERKGIREIRGFIKKMTDRRTKGKKP